MNGTASGGGYELALACDDLIDDGSSTSRRRRCCLGVLPGTGGLTRLVDRRRAPRPRRFLLDHRRGHAWRARRRVGPRRRGRAAVVPPRTTTERAGELARRSDRPWRGAAPRCRRWRAPRPRRRSTTRVTLLDPARRVATLPYTPAGRSPATRPSCRRRRDAWAIAARRELDDALLHLRTNEPEIGVVLLRTEGDAEAVLAADNAGAERGHWLVRETLLLQRRVLKRLTSADVLCDRRRRRRCRVTVRAGARRRPQLHGRRRSARRVVGTQLRPSFDGERPHPAGDPLQ